MKTAKKSQKSTEVALHDVNIHHVNHPTGLFWLCAMKTYRLNDRALFFFFLLFSSVVLYVCVKCLSQRPFIALYERSWQFNDTVLNDIDIMIYFSRSGIVCARNFFPLLPKICFSNTNKGRERERKMNLNIFVYCHPKIESVWWICSSNSNFTFTPDVDEISHDTGYWTVWN